MLHFRHHSRLLHIGSDPSRHRRASMYKNNISSKPKKFGRLKFSSNKPARRFKGGNFKRKKSFPKKRGFSEHIDFSRFIKKGQQMEEKPYISKHTFIDFPFNPQIHKNIARAGFIHPRPIQDQAIFSVLEG